MAFFVENPRIKLKKLINCKLLIKKSIISQTISNLKRLDYMLKKILFGFSLLFLFSFIKREKEFNIGDTSPLSDLMMKNIVGTELSLKKAVGKKGLLVVFSCNTCPFVVGNETFPGWEKQYNKIYDDAKLAEVNMILVNSNEAKREDDDSFEEMQKHSKTLAYKMPYVVDKNSELANAYGAKTTPHVFFLNADLKLIYKGSIDNSWDTKRTDTLSYVTSALEEIKNDKTIKTNSSDPRGCSIKRKK